MPLLYAVISYDGEWLYRNGNKIPCFRLFEFKAAVFDREDLCDNYNCHVFDAVRTYCTLFKNF